MGGAAKKNLRVFREICGDKHLGHVRIVTTNWNLVDEKQGNSRQDALAKGAFGPLIKEGAELRRHDNSLQSAQSIMSQLIHQEPVTMMIQEEVNAGRTLGDTSAGALIVEEIKELKKKHDKEVETLKKELEDASMANDEELILELAEERRKLEEMMVRTGEDQKTLKKTRVLRETPPISDVGKRVQPAGMGATKVASDVPRFPPIPQHRYRSQGNETTGLHDTRMQPAEMKATVVPSAFPSVPPPQHRYRPQRQGNEIAGFYDMRVQSTEMRANVVNSAAPSVPPPQHRYGPQRQGNKTTGLRNTSVQPAEIRESVVVSAFPSVFSPPQHNYLSQRQGNETTGLHDARVQPAEMGANVIASAFPSVHPQQQLYRPQRQENKTTYRESQLPQALHDRWMQSAEMRANAVPRVPPPPCHRYRLQRQGNNTSDRELHPSQLYDMVEATKDYSNAGGERHGGFGAMTGGFVGLCLSPFKFIAAKRAMVRRQ